MGMAGARRNGGMRIITGIMCTSTIIRTIITTITITTIIIITMMAMTAAGSLAGLAVNG